ncbi:MAG: GIY-YIG nuclease family protein [Candidatus Omnitrophota bacterium]
MEYTVYILRSKLNPEKFYIGYTTDLKKRLKNHQQPNESAYTRRFAPWELETYVVCKNEQTAKNFEEYLKSHSGRSFLRKRLI